MVSMLKIDNVCVLACHSICILLNLSPIHIVCHFAFCIHHIYQFWYMVCHLTFLHFNYCQSHWDGEIYEMNMFVL